MANFYIQGNPSRAQEIKAAFESKGCEKSNTRDYSNEHWFFFTYKGKVICTDDEVYIDLVKGNPDYQELELPVEPCFKEGDKIEATIYGIKRRVTIREVDKTNRCYFGTLEECIGFSEQGQWQLATKPHYDISNFHAGMPVLVRDDDDEEWNYLHFSHYRKKSSDHFFAAGNTWFQCIPFNNDTKHLLGTTDMPSEEYINW